MCDHLFGMCIEVLSMCTEVYAMCTEVVTDSYTRRPSDGPLGWLLPLLIPDELPRGGEFADPRDPIRGLRLEKGEVMLMSVHLDKRGRKRWTMPEWQVVLAAASVMLAAASLLVTVIELSARL